MAKQTGFLSPKNARTGIIVGMVIVFLGAGYASWKQFERYQRISAEVKALEAEEEKARKENESLKERIKYFETENFQEQESKERLNMRKDSEYVVEIERIQKKPETDVKIQGDPTTSLERVPNYKKWWEKLF